jgi:AsmA family protein
MTNPMRRIPRSVLWALGAAGVLIVAVALFLSWFNWNMLREPLARRASIALGRPVRIDGDLVVHPWSLTPSATVGGLTVGDPAWMHGGDLAEVRSLTVAVKLWPLMFGQLDIPLIRADRPIVALYRDAGGRNNWQLGNATHSLNLPPIHRFIISDGHIQLHDLRRGLTVIGVMQSSEGGNGRGAFHLTGKGALNREPFLVTITGGPLLEVRRDRPYPFQAAVRTGPTRVLAAGEVLKPFDFGQLRADLTVSGTDFADLYDLTGLALPTTPPYALHGELIRNGTTYAFRNVVGRVGSSDLEGVFTVEHHGDRPDLHADLRSRALRLADLGTLLGAPPPGPVKSAPQRIEAARLATEQRLLPDAQLNVRRVRAMDADLRYRAASLYTRANLPLRSFALHLTLDHGVLSADPLEFSMPHGALTGRVRIDARPDVPLSDIDLRLTNLRAEDFFRQALPALSGLIEARAELHGVGASVHAAASTADGSFTVVAPHAEIRKALAELLGVDVIRGLGLVLAKDQSQTGVRCAVADFQARHGVLIASSLVLDTDPVLATGRGSIDLRSETLDLSLQGHPKRFQLIRVSAPITLTGHLKSPKLGVKAGSLPVQAAAAVVLGAVLSPLAAVLPFVDPGLAKNADCASLVAGAKANGAPVRVAQTSR